MKRKSRRKLAIVRQPFDRLPRRDVAQPAALKSGPPPGLISIREAAKRLGRCELTIYRWIRRGLLKVKLVGWRVFVEAKSVDWWLTPRMYEPRRPAPPWLRQYHRKKGGLAAEPPAPAPEAKPAGASSTDAVQAPATVGGQS